VAAVGRLSDSTRARGLVNLLD